MKILAIPSCLDLRLVYGITPAWWQFLKGFYEEGVEVIAVPYRGQSMETLWFRSYKNPCKTEGDFFAWGKTVLDKMKIRRRFAVPAIKNKKEEMELNVSERIMLNLIHNFVLPKWKKLLKNIFNREKDLQAVIFFGVPINHLNGLPTYIRKTFGVPVFFYDGDIPASLPGFGGFHSGFRIYQDANLREYDGFITNSNGGKKLVEELGAKNVHHVYWGVDPELFKPFPLKKNIDFFFYGVADEYRQDWINKMLVEPSKIWKDKRFAIRIKNFSNDLGRVKKLPYVSFCELTKYVSRTKINLCINRDAHRTVYASASSRPFELAAMGACIVSNPYLGVEEWFEPDKEIIIVNDEKEIKEKYEWLLNHESEREKIGKAAREKVLKNHTHRHRAKEFIKIMGLK